MNGHTSEREFAIESSPEGDVIRPFGPSVQTMLLDTADPLAGRAGRSVRETAPR